MTVSAWSTEAWADTEGASPPLGGEWGGLTPNKFVSASAGGSGNGTTSNPWSLRQAMDNAAAGDTVGVHAGVYVGTNPRPDKDPSDETIRLHPAWAPANNGTASNPIVFVAQYPAAHHTSRPQYTDLRSGSDGKNPGTGGTYYYSGEVSTYGWPAFGAGFYSGGNHCHWIGMYANESDSDNHIYEDCGLCDVRGKTGVQISQCRLVGWLDRPRRVNNYSLIRPEESSYCTITDNHFSDCQSGICGYEDDQFTFSHNTIVDCDMGMILKSAKVYCTGSART